jgi:hypothetical protein
MSKRKRAPHDQLIEAGKQARDILADRGVIKKDHHSAIASILQNPNAPILPGGGGSPVSPQPYIPRPWTIHATRTILKDIGRIWQIEVANDDVRKNNGLEFFKFILEELNHPNTKLNTAIKNTVDQQQYDQSLLSRKETIEAVKRLFIDSFAIAVIVHAYTDTADYLEWFLYWTDQLLNQWPKDQRWIDSGNTPTAPNSND